MKRSRLLFTMSIAGVLALVALGLPAAASAASGASTAQKYGDDPYCQSHSSLCIDTYDNAGSEYVGHDEPSVEFKSGVPGSGNDITYVMTLPTEPNARPSASGQNGATWNFQLRPTFWFGLTLCDTASAPEFTNVCAPDTDANDLVGTDPAAPDYIGKHPGNAFMELQFYGPGYVPQFEGFGCTATQYCAAMTIDSRTLDQNRGTGSGTENNKDCNRYVLGGPEPINWAYITKDGVSQAPANPLFTGTLANPNFSAVNPNAQKDLFMNPGDRIRIHMHDTDAGFKIDLLDLTTGQSGSMTASIANGFGHILYEPTSTTCHMAPYAFHPEYSTANPRGNTWSQHTYNVAMSDEIGHFENCLKVDAEANCVNPGAQDRSGGLDEDDGNNFCVPKQDSLLIKIDGCFSDDLDWDGPSYQLDWPGTNPNVNQDRALHPSPVLFTSPLTNNGSTNYSTIAFETNLPGIEAAQDNPPRCNRTTGANCVNPPNGAQFYPFFSTRVANGTCTWQEGGRFIPGTTNDFGGSSTAEFGPLLKSIYPAPVFTTVSRINNFNSGDLANPCRVS